MVAEPARQEEDPQKVGRAEPTKPRELVDDVFAGMDAEVAEPDQAPEETDEEVLARYSKNVSTEGYKKARWGMTEKALKKAVSGLIEGKTGLTSKIIKVAGSDAIVAYSFLESGHLSDVMVLFLAKRRSAEVLIEDFKLMARLLTSKYGKPLSIGPEFLGDNYRSREGKWGTGLAVGKVSFEGLWQTEETDIELTLSSRDTTISHLIRYKSIDLWPFMAKEIEEKRMSDL